MTPTTAGLADLYVGDVLEFCDYMYQGGMVPDVIVTSPPYNLMKAYDRSPSKDELAYHDYLQWCLSWLRKLERVSATNGRLLLNVPLDTSLGGPRPLGADMLCAAQEAGWRPRPTIVWADNHMGRRTAWGSWLRATAPNVSSPVELVLVLHKGDWARKPETSTISRDDFIAWTNGLWTFGGESAKRRKHPAPFPEELPRRLLSLFSFKEDLVFDPFVGSGTTCAVATALGRRSIGLDLSEQYISQTAARLLGCAPVAPWQEAA